MISVIVPTMWKATEINIMLPKLNDHNLIDEIILIDNDPTAKNAKTCSLSKVNYQTYGENIYCNPAWNRGYSIAKNDKLIFINDDVAFAITVIDAIHDKITEENGMILAYPEFVKEPIPGNYVLREMPANKLEFKPIPKLRHKCAIFFGLHKSNFTEIPEQLKVHTGDAFLFQLCAKKKKPNLAIHHAEFRTKMSSTVKDFRHITKQDGVHAPSIFKKYGIER